MFYLDHRAQEKDGELEVKIDVEMSLDDWKALQEASRPKVEFNIRKAEDKIPNRAKVIHQSRQQEVRNLTSLWGCKGFKLMRPIFPPPSSCYHTHTRA